MNNNWSLLCFAMFVFIVASMPIALADKVVTATEQIKEGKVVFETIAGIGCKGCHGEFAEGDLGVGPFIRGATEGSIRAAIEGTGEMVVVKNVISDEQIQTVSAYLEYLGSVEVVRTLSKRGRFLPESVAVKVGANLQIIVKNSGIKPATFQSDNMNIEPFTVAGRSTSSFEWQSPAVAGKYTIYCVDCKLKEQLFTVTVNADGMQEADCE